MAVTISSVTDLTLITTATPDSVPLGSNLTFSVTVTNVGNVPATGVVITDTLPATGFSLFSVSQSPNYACVPTLPTVACTLR